MNYGTATSQLKKKIFLSLLQELGRDICYRCEKKIETSEELSVDHKENWKGKDNSLFWDLSNIAYSHCKCNSRAGSIGNIPPTKIECPEGQAWCSGCRACLSADNFHRQSSRTNSSGLRPHCKDCRKKKGI